MNKNKWIIVVGDPIDGINIVGPFDDFEFAKNYATMFYRHETWWITKLIQPEIEDEVQDECT